MFNCSVPAFSPQNRVMLLLVACVLCTAGEGSDGLRASRLCAGSLLCGHTLIATVHVPCDETQSGAAAATPLAGTGTHRKLLQQPPPTGAVSQVRADSSGYMRAACTNKRVNELVPHQLAFQHQTRAPAHCRLPMTGVHWCRADAANGLLQ